MVVLRAIGGFFAKIGRWIKNTAWVQPLLIVGGIFAIIFSIPYISKWVSSWFEGGETAGTKYYSSHKVSLSGAQNSEGTKSDANQLFDYMANPDRNADKDAVNRWGEKFFIVFAQEECEACETIYKGFQALEDGWGNGEFAKPENVKDVNYYPFKVYSIFVDTEETVNDETKNLFKDYFFNDYDINFEEINASMQDAPYAKNTKDSGYAEDLTTLADADSFKSPTVFLFDPSNEDGVKNQLDVNEVLFTVPGKNGDTGPYPIARTLYDCWYHLDLFSSSYNA